jgi:hypothetical protein
VLEIIGHDVKDPLKLELSRNMPLDMDWDGRSRGYEAINVLVEVRPEELDAEGQSEKLLFTIT